MSDDDIALPPGRWVKRKGGVYEFVRASRRPVAKCGTDAGYQKHLRLKEETCRPCRDARRERMAEYRRNPPPPKVDGLKPCGTHAAYNRHLMRGESACADCMAGERKYQNARPKSRRRRAA